MPSTPRPSLQPRLLICRPMARQGGLSLVVVMILLVIVSMLGISAAQLSMMTERGARNDRDTQVAWQAADAALMDAEFDMRGPGTAPRKNLFAADTLYAFPFQSCGNSGTSKGLCDPGELIGKPLWLSTDLAADDAPVAEYGEFTGRDFPSGSQALLPSKKPRYMIEVLPDRNAFGDASGGAEKKFVYRVTSIGFGNRTDIQSVLQMIFRKE